MPFNLSRIPVQTALVCQGDVSHSPRLVPQMNAGRTVTWRPQPWQDADGGGGEPLSDSDSEEEDFPDDTTTPLGEYITQGEIPTCDCGAWVRGSEQA